MEVRLSGKERLPVADLRKDTADRPHIHCVVVDSVPSQKFGSAVPSCRHVVSKLLSVLVLAAAGKPKVTKLDDPKFTNQQVLRLDVSVHHVSPVHDLD